MELQIIQSKIFTLRGERVMLDFDLALLYEVETRVLNQTVKRNPRRFPEDFMFQLTWEELKNLKSQFVTSSWGGTRKRPFAFTELHDKELADINEVLQWLGEENQARINENQALQKSEITPSEWVERARIGFRKDT
jgi:hypothetical protein